MALAEKKTSKDGGKSRQRPVGKIPVKRAVRRSISPKRGSRRSTARENLKLQKFPENPIIALNGHHKWESQYVFNPAAVYEDGKVHLVYRAIGDGGVSVFGYASSKNGLYIDERLNQPIYAPRDLLEREGREQIIVYTSSSGGSWGGCEDPRITKLNGKFYVTYTAFNSYPRVALTSIDRNDFLSKRWRWREPVFISPPGEVHKNWAIFPEKINGKYAILHGITPSILIEYLDSLEFDGTTFIKSSRPPNEKVELRKGVWDSRVRGVGAPPIKTQEGWLVMYHAIDDRDSGKYKLGAMILDYENPEKILHRSATPILEPDKVYENDGFKSGVVYSCGAVVIGGTLFVYYGGADSIICVATANLNEFLDALKKGGAARIKKTKALS